MQFLISQVSYTKFKSVICVFLVFGFFFVLTVLFCSFHVRASICSTVYLFIFHNSSDYAVCEYEINELTWGLFSLAVY